MSATLKVIGCFFTTTGSSTDESPINRRCSSISILVLDCPTPIVNNPKMTAVYYYMERDGARTMVAVCVVEPTLEQSILVMDIKDKVKDKHLSLAQVDVFDLALFSRGTEINNADAWDPDAMDGSTKEKPLRIMVTTAPYPTAGMSLCARYSNRNCVHTYFTILPLSALYSGENARTAEALIQLQKRIDAIEILDSKAISCADYVQEKEQQNRITFGWTPSAPDDFSLFPAVLFDENNPAAQGSETNDVKPYWKEILETPLIDGLRNGYETGRLATKFPDVSFYPETIERPSAADFVAFGDCKGSGWSGTSRTEIGQAMLYAHRILDVQPQRLHVYGFVTNNQSVVLVRGYRAESRPFAVCWDVSSVLTFEAGMKAFFYLMNEDNGCIGSPTVCGIPLAIKHPLRPGGSCRAFTATCNISNVIAKLYGDGHDLGEEA
jgi:hypothetical protein